MQAAELAQRITSNNAPWVIDARSEFEFKQRPYPECRPCAVSEDFAEEGALAREQEFRTGDSL